MKKNILTLMLAAGIVTSLGSCSLFNKVTGKTDSSEAGNDKEVSQEAVLPHDRQHIAVKKELKTYTPEELGKGVVKAY